MTAPIRSMPELDERYELYRVVTDFEALQEAFLERVEDLEVTRESLDVVGGFTPGYSAKLLCQPPMKAIGKDSLPKILKATGMALVLVIDDERFAQVKANLIKRKRKVRAIARIKRVKGFFNKENAQKYGSKRWDGLTEKQRSRIAKRAVNARWRAIRRRRRMGGASNISQDQSSSADVKSQANT